MTKFNFTKILVLLISFQLLVSYGYSPRIDMEYKGGNKRHIGRYGMLIPLYEPRNSLFFTNMFLMHDSKFSVEGNFGIGLRRKISNYSILGIHGFWDIRKIKNVSKKIHQATFGAEYLMSKFEVRINGYLPQNKRFLVSSLDVRNATKLTRSYDASIGAIGVTTQTVDYNITTTSTYEIPLAGFDAEVGGNIFNKFESHVAYYHFNGRKGAKSVNGWRFRSLLYLLNKKNQRLDIQGELSYDNVRKWSNYLGIKLTWFFARNNSRPVRNSIEDKMTQMVIRDVDVISTGSSEDTVSLISDIEKQDGFSAMLLSSDDIKALGLTDVEIVGINETIFSEASTVFTNKIRSMRSKLSYDLMGGITKDEDGILTFVPLLNSDNSINIQVSEKIAQSLSEAGKTVSTVLARTDKQKQALIKLYNQGVSDNQDNSLSAQLARKQKWKDIFNKEIQRNKNYRLVTNELVDKVCEVYARAFLGLGYHAVPIIITDPVADRELGLPSVDIILKLPTETFNNLPNSIKNTLINAGVNPDNELDIFYEIQDLTFSFYTAAPINPAELARVRFHPYVHPDAPERPPVAYDRKSYIKTFFTSANGNNLTEVDIGHINKGLVFTHTVGADPYTRWSPAGTMGVPSVIYNPTNKIPEGEQPPGMFYSIGIRDQENAVTLGKRSVVTLHHIVSSDDSRKLGNLITNNDFDDNYNLEDTLNIITVDTSAVPLDNTDGFIDNIKIFAALNYLDLNTSTNYFEYNGNFR